MCLASIIQSRTEPADVAVGLTPKDPEGHYTRALALVNAQRLGEAVSELQQAIRLRPHHYYQWLDLGVTLDRLDDSPGADLALRQSIALAPAFTQPRWQLGNLLYRQGRYEESFAELRLGSKSNPTNFESLLDLAWVASDGDVGLFERLVKPDDTLSHLEVAFYLANRGKGADGVRHVSDAGTPTDESSSAVLRQVIGSLLASKQFSDAYSAWSLGHRRIDNGPPDRALILNGDFLNEIRQNDPGFDWQLAPLTAVDVSIDPAGPVESTRSLHLDFKGESAPGIMLMHQLVLVQPKSRYSLTFMSKTRDLVTGGPPRIVVLNAGANVTEILGESKAFPPGTSEWQTSQIDFFTTKESTLAIVIGLQRLSCSQAPCPIFGGVWLSRFSLTRIS